MVTFWPTPLIKPKIISKLKHRIATELFSSSFFKTSNSSFDSSKDVPKMSCLQDAHALLQEIFAYIFILEIVFGWIIWYKTRKCQWAENLQDLP